MSSPNLSVDIGADVSGIDKAGEALKKLGRDAGAAAASATKDFDKAGMAVDKFGKITAASSNRAGQSLTDLGRIVQDIPFGFVGIQNNINPAVESFQRLKVETGSTGAALKALVGSLVGAGGFGFALSLVSSAITLASVGMGAWTRAFGTNKTSVDSNKKALDEYNKAVQEQVSYAAQQLASVSKLVAVIQLETASQKERQNALKQLQQNSASYFSGLKLEEGVVKGLAEAYRLYADNIFRVAKVKGAEQQIEKLSKELVSVTEQLNNANQSISQLSVKESFFGLDRTKKSQEEINNILKDDLITFQNIKRLSELTGLSEQKINEGLLKRQQFKTKELQLVAQISDLSKTTAQNDIGKYDTGPQEKKIDKVAEVIAKLKADRESIKNDPLLPSFQKPIDEIREIQGAIKRLMELKVNPESSIIQNLIGDIRGLSTNGINRDIDAYFKQIRSGVKTKFSNDDSVILKVAPEIDKSATDRIQDQVRRGNLFSQANSLKIPVSFEMSNEELQKSVDEKIKYFEYVGQSISGLLTSPIEALFESLASGSGNALEAFSNALKGVLVRLIATATAAAAVAAILSIIPGFSIASAGKAISGFQGLFSLFAGIPKFADGGIVSGPTMAMVGEYPGAKNNPEVIAPLNKLQSMLGGSGGGPVDVSGEFIVRGTDLVVVLERANKFLGR